MNALTPKQRARALACLVEGNSIRGTCRMTGMAKRTVERILREALARAEAEGAVA